MKWAHLPNAGGLYDQDPDLLDKFTIIFKAIGDRDREEADKTKAEQEKIRKQNSRTPGGMRSARGPRPPRR